MSGVYGTPGVPPKLTPFIADVKARLASVRMVHLLGGAGRIYANTDDFSTAPAGVTEADTWSRLVILPATQFWDLEEQPGHNVLLTFITRGEVHPPADPAYNPATLLESIQQEVFVLLQAWVPGVHAGAYRVREGVYRHTQPQAQPMYDDQRGLWMTSAQYRASILPLAPA